MVRHDLERGVPSQRQLRVGELVRKTLVDVFQRGNFRDPDLVSASITVSEVAVSRDLKAATVWVMPLAGRDRDPVLAGLSRAAPYLRREVARRVRLRSVPALTFRIDSAFDASSRMNLLLSDLEVTTDSEAADGT